MRRPSERPSTAPMPEFAPHLRTVSERRDRDSKAVRVEEDELVSVRDTSEWPEGFNEQLFTVDLADRFLRLQEQDRVGQLRLAEAGLQNVIGRAWHAGLVSDTGKFKRTFKDALNLLRGDKDVEIEGKPITKYAEEVFDGIDATMGVIRELEQSFPRRKASPESRQMVATNDRLDAGDKIDLVEVQYRPGKAGPALEQVWLVQVKRAQIPSSDVKKNHEAHERFVRGLVTERAYRTVRESKAAELLKGQFRLEDLYGKAASLFTALKDGAAEGNVSDQQIEAAVGMIPLPSAVLKAWFMDVRAKDALSGLLQAAGATLEQGDFIISRLRRWAVAYPPNSEELRRVLPAPAVIGASNFVSVVVHGGRAEKQPILLPAGEAKALTAA